MARSALTPLFDAYQEARERGREWRAQIDRGNVHHDAELASWFDVFQHVQLYPLAACIALIVDNCSRTYVREMIGLAEYQRVNFGDLVGPGIRFGKMLWCEANAARHYAGTELRSENEEVLNAFGIEARDEQATYLLLERSGISTEADLLRQFGCHVRPDGRRKAKGHLEAAAGLAVHGNKETEARSSGDK